MPEYEPTALKMVIHNFRLDVHLRLIGMADALQNTPLSTSGINITQPAIIPSIQRQTYIQKNCLLSEGERLAIEPFKERYKSEGQRERRVALAKSEILTAYFNYLHTQNRAPKTEEELKEKTKVREFSYNS